MQVALQKDAAGLLQPIESSSGSRSGPFPASKNRLIFVCKLAAYDLFVLKSRALQYLDRSQAHAQSRDETNARLE
jgi:hypothetical protein